MEFKLGKDLRQVRDKEKGGAITGSPNTMKGL